MTPGDGGNPALTPRGESSVDRTSIKVEDITLTLRDTATEKQRSARTITGFSTRVAPLPEARSPYSVVSANHSRIVWV